MPLPFIFANATTVTTPQIDADFAALGALTAIASTVTGTNALTISPLPNTPTISAYANYQPFAGIAASSNTGPTSARVGGLASLTVFKDSATGPVTLVGGEVIAGNLITLVYDAALASGAGGFHLQFGPPTVSGSYLPLIGGTLTGGLIGTTGTFSGLMQAATVTSTGAITGASASVSGLLAGATITTGGTLQGASVNATGNLSGNKLIVAGGNSITRILFASTPLTFSPIAPGSAQGIGVTIAGASIGDVVGLGLPATLTPGIVFDGRVSGTALVSVRASNITTGTVTPAAGTYQIQVTGFS